MPTPVNYFQTPQDLSSFRSTIGYETLSPSERQFADSWIGNNIDQRAYNPGWNKEYGGEFQSALSTWRTRQDTDRARARYGELTNPNSTYNQNRYSRLERMNRPDSYQDTMLYHAMGLGAESSAFLGSQAFNERQVKARSATYNQFQESMERTEQAALGYLDLASGKETALLKIMSDENLAYAQLKQQREIEEKRRKSQLWNSVAKTVLGVGATLLAPYLAPGIGASLAATGTEANPYVFSPVEVNP